MSAFPPIYTRSGLNVSPETALLYLSAYLESAKTSHHLLPNARLEVSGPTSGSSKSSVTIHNLQRVEAGLKGEWLAPRLDLEEEEVKKAGKLKGGEEVVEEGWEDLDQYQRDQSVEGLGVGRDDLDVEDDGDVEENAQVHFYGNDNGDGDVNMGETQAEKVKTPSNGTGGAKGKRFEKPINKEARKKAKKDRLKADRQAKEERRKRTEISSELTPHVID